MSRRARRSEAFVTSRPPSPGTTSPTRAWRRRQREPDVPATTPPRSRTRAAPLRDERPIGQPSRRVPDRHARSHRKQKHGQPRRVRLPFVQCGRVTPGRRDARNRPKARAEQVALLSTPQTLGRSGARSDQRVARGPLRRCAARPAARPSPASTTLDRCGGICTASVWSSRQLRSARMRLASAPYAGSSETWVSQLAGLSLALRRSLVTP